MSKSATSLKITEIIKPLDNIVKLKEWFYIVANALVFAEILMKQTMLLSDPCSLHVNVYTELNPDTEHQMTPLVVCEWVNVDR